VKTLLSQVVLKVLPALEVLSIGSRNNSKPNPIDTNSGRTSHIGTW
jgi:hypothetical protein